MDTASFRRSRRLRAIPLSIVAGVVALTLAGCFGNPLQQVIEDTVQERVTEEILDGVAGEGSDVELSSVPDSFPKELPLPDAAPALAYTTTEDGSSHWLISYQVSDSAALLNELRDEYLAMGFTEASSMEMTGMLSSTLEGSGYSVTLSSMGEDPEAMFSVTVLETD